MSKIYKGQTALRIQVTMHQDISEAQETLIKYEKPDKSTGQWSASVEDFETGVVYHDVSDSEELDQAGTWRFWGYVTFSDGRSAPGEAVKVKIYEEGT